MRFLFSALLCGLLIILFQAKTSAQTCNIPAGGNGVALGKATPIIIDGNMSDWVIYLGDPDNSAYDKTGGIDLDAPVADAGRDLVRFAFTEDASNLFIYLERAGSANNTADIILYIDINNNGFMDLREPVVHMNWNGSTGNIGVTVYNYNPTATSSQNSTMLNGDGSPLKGSLSNRISVGTNGKGSVNGITAEIKIPFSFITTVNAAGTVTDALIYGKNFTFHLSSINGNVSSIPGLNSINDNMGGCLKAPAIVLPVSWGDFTAKLLKGGSVELTWTTATEKDVNYFVVEKSNDGISYHKIAKLAAAGNSIESKSYQIIDFIGEDEESVLYYRIVEVDANSNPSYSPIRIVKRNQNESSGLISTYPNPVNDLVRVTIPNAWQGKKVRYEVLNMIGVGFAKIELTTASQTETIDTRQFAKGVYILKVSCGRETAISKIIKQ